MCIQNSLCTILRWFSDGYSVNTGQQFLSPPYCLKNGLGSKARFPARLKMADPVGLNHRSPLFEGKLGLVKLGHPVFELQGQPVAFCRGEKVRDNNVTFLVQLLTQALSRKFTSKSYASIFLFWLYCIKINTVETQDMPTKARQHARQQVSKNHAVCPTETIPMLMWPWHWSDKFRSGSHTLR